MEAQIENAILVAFDPQSSQTLKAQAFEFFNQLRTNPQGWPSCLSLALQKPHAQEVVRLGALEVVINAVTTGVTDEQGLDYIKAAIIGYIRNAYAENISHSDWDTYPIENKFVQLLTYLFVKLYQTNWTTFFDDVLGICASGNSRESGHHRGIRLYLRTLGAIHDEIGDTLVPRAPESQKHANEVKDLIRERDVAKIARSWIDILHTWHESSKDIFNECLIVVGKWATWIDLTLIINEPFLNILVSSILGAAHADAAEEANPAANAMLEILTKKMNPEDKMHLLNIFRLQDIVAQISDSPRLQDRSSSDYDTDLAELVAKIVNTVVMELVIISDTKGIAETVSAGAQEKIRYLLPFLLRYFADDFDEVCSTVIPALTEFLSFVRKRPDQAGAWIPVLPTILYAIVAKMKYDDTSDWGSDDSGTEEAEFQDLRKRLENLQQTIANIDEDSYIETVRGVVVGAFDTFQVQAGQLDWRLIDLALYEMFGFGAIAQKNGALYSKNKPITRAAETLVEMLSKMSDSGIARYNHPAVQLQYMELCVRYHIFFDHNVQRIPLALENFAAFIHHTHVKVRQRSWYLFFRFTKLLKPHVGSVARTIIQSIGPLLAISAEQSRSSTDDDDTSSSNEANPDSKFQSQLYLYEAVGSISSAPGVSSEEQLVFVKAVVEPQFTDLESQLTLARAGSEQAILQVHHIILALGQLAHGFVDSHSNSLKRSAHVVPELSAEFARVAEAILVALDSLKQHVQVRDAARTAFARLLGVLGANILPQLPRWFSGLLTVSSSKDEIASFLRLLGQAIFALNTEVSSFLNDLLTPLLERVFAGMSESTNGTDDEIQLVELRTHYLSFLLVVLNQGLSHILVSAENQGVFEAMITSIELFTSDSEDLLTAKIAFQVLSKMSDIWGGPSVQNASTTTQLQKGLPGFEEYMLKRFSGRIWILLGKESFDPNDAKSRQVLLEAASMQKQIFDRIGTRYLEWLRTTELKDLGMRNDAVDTYLLNLAQMDLKGFKQFFLKLAQSIRADR